MLREGGYRLPAPLTNGVGRAPMPSRPRPRPPVVYGLIGLVVSADPERGEVLVQVQGGLRAEPFVGRCVRARLECRSTTLQDREGRCSLLLDHLYVDDRVEVRTRLPADLGPRPPSAVRATQVILLDPRCAGRAA